MREIVFEEIRMAAEALLASHRTQAGHGIDHALRVVANAQQIHASEGGDWGIISLAALLHDVGDAKFHNGIERSGEFARAILAEHQATPSLIESVVHIVDNISFRNRDTSAPLTWEGQIVQDADRLEALGAIGVVRTIEYGATRQQPFFIPGDPPAQQRSGVGHFYQKLFLLKDMLNTQTARRLAEDREEFMRQFLAQYLLEMSVAENVNRD